MIHYRGGSKVGYRASVDYQALNWIGFGMIGDADSSNDCGNNPASEGADFGARNVKVMAYTLVQ